MKWKEVRRNDHVFYEVTSSLEGRAGVGGCASECTTKTKIMRDVFATPVNIKSTSLECHVCKSLFNKSLRI